MFNSIIGDSLTFSSASICIITSIILGIFISFVHMKTTKYNKNFIVSLSVMPLIVSMIIIMVNGNLGTSVAIVGAFSLIRFRSIPGNSKEIISVFLAMSIGLAIGMGQVVFASLVTLVTGLILLLLTYSKFGNEETKYKTLDILIPEDLDYDTVFDKVLKKYTEVFEIIKVKTSNMGSLYELKYKIEMKKNISEKKFIDELRVLNGNLKISISKAETEEML
ncbi:MAG: DUF4956 domain-containing protein [Bacilli bacterium]|nr:DUF4956 domain-containing protein [Bacilli bacterium]